MTTPSPASLPRTDPGPGPDAGLHADTIGIGPRLVLAHGFTQTGRVWAGLDVDLSTDHQVVRVDLPGHGGSSSVAASLEQGAQLLGAVGGRATYLGYSMGARFCLHLALARPDLVDRLILVSGTAGIDDPEERRLRREADGALADRLDPPDGGPGESVEEFLRRWMANPMFAGIPPEADGLAERLRNTGPGLASSLRLAGTGTQPPSWGRLGRLTMPVLIVTGERDGKFTALGDRMARSIGTAADRAVVPAAGHAPHLEHPDEVARLVRAHGAGTH
jgi:2-succinyl-6-hydroxy-2,4-cyclohexadiene-1-carboxylate synthase